jgi:hypothetical protein
VVALNHRRACRLDADSSILGKCPNSAFLIFAGFRRLLSLGFELGFCRKAFTLVFRHCFRVVQNAG